MGLHFMQWGAVPCPFRSIVIDWKQRCLATETMRCFRLSRNFLYYWQISLWIALFWTGIIPVWHSAPRRSDEFSAGRHPRNCVVLDLWLGVWASSEKIQIGRLPILSADCAQKVTVMRSTMCLTANCHPFCTPSAQSSDFRFSDEARTYIPWGPPRIFLL